ncbi:Fatty acid desaturase [Arboricoccus pini]|uniref:Fatty acid desaturase n=1 Tax=Arboricoccus pini TaxID=1963835 RepID=A0A212QMV8_9PROT|nr:fatty acid desaturase [Arboricoccus pini]SNB60697.1 Fatty acid desaturase [Arboricoccus pini]
MAGRGIEWPTMGLTALVYGGWLALTYFHSDIPLVLLLPAAAWFMAWHMSLQHEVIHDHPTPFRWVNDFIGFWPLGLWLPYAIYRHSHRCHHQNDRLTDPIDDPESYYLTPAQAKRLRHRFVHFYRVIDTLAGRVVLGPLHGILVFLAGQAWRLMTGNRKLLGIWALHAAGIVPILFWVLVVCDMSLWSYLLVFVYPGFALALVRSFAEHRAAPATAHRTAIVENAPVLGLLFLYNNLHVVHHDKPGLPWYAIPAYYRRHRERLVAGNGGLVYDGYLDVADRFLFRPHDRLVHPAYPEEVTGYDSSDRQLGHVRRAVATVGE